MLYHSISDRVAQGPASTPLVAELGVTPPGRDELLFVQNA